MTHDRCTPQGGTRARLTRRSALRVLVSGLGVGLLAACAPTAPASKPEAPAATAKPAATTAPAAAPTSAPAKPAESKPAESKPAASKPAEAPKPAAAAAAPAKPAGAPTSGGTLRVGQVGDLVNLDPHFYQGTTSENTWLAYDRLIAYDLQLKPQPMLAERWELTPDAKQITLKLRQGVQFHSGRELVAEDVRYSLNRVLDPKIGVGQLAAQAKWFSAVETPDTYTVVMKTEQPRPQMFDFFESFNIVDKETLEGPDAQSKSAGTGPFTFVEWVPGDHVTYAKNKNYWQGGKPYLDTIQVNMFRDAQAMMVQLEAGAVDVVRFPPKLEYARLRADPKFQALAHPNGGNAYLLGANVLNPPLDNKLVRQALNYAIDRKRFVDTILGGVGAVQSLPWSETSPLYEAAKNEAYPFDLEKAKALLSQAGVSNVELNMSPSPIYPEGGPFSEMYQADLGKIGVKLNIIKLEQAAWSDQVNNRKYSGLYFASSIFLQLAPGNVFAISRPLNPNDNNEGFKSEQYTKLATDASLETDPAKLKQIYSGLNEIILDESFLMYLSPNLLTMIARAGVNGTTPHLHGGWLFTDTWLDR